jgi:hypothetical protein
MSLFLKTCILLSQCEGREFDPPPLHHVESDTQANLAGLAFLFFSEKAVHRDKGASSIASQVTA